MDIPLLNNIACVCYKNWLTQGCNETIVELVNGNNCTAHLVCTSIYVHIWHDRITYESRNEQSHFLLWQEQRGSYCCPSESSSVLIDSITPIWLTWSDCSEKFLDSAQSKDFRRHRTQGKTTWHATWNLIVPNRKLPWWRAWRNSDASIHP